MVPMTALAPSINHRDPKGRKFVSIVETAYDKAGLTEVEAQRVNDTPGLSDMIAQFIAEHRTTDKYKDEEVTSNYGYLSGYKPTLVHDQVQMLKKLFPERGDNPTVGNLAGDVPNGAEGKFALPNIWRPEPALTGNYNNVVPVLDLIKQDRNGKFYSYRDGQLGPERLRQSARTEATMRKLSEEQGHPDILVIAAQFGLQHRGRSVRRAREVMVDQGQYGLGAFAIGVMLLTHPNRLEHYDDLWIDCAGDEFDDPDAAARFDHAPCFEFQGSKVKFGASWTDGALGNYGSASGVLPQ
jgi:hypothetical protein